MKTYNTISNIRKLWTHSIFTLLLSLFLSEAANAQTFLASQYNYSTSTGAALDPMTSATVLTPTGGTDDGVSATQLIGFTFNFEGMAYTEFGVSVDGFVKLGSGITSDYSNAISDNSNLPKLFPYWDDLALGGSGNLKTALIGTAPNRIRIIQWFVTIPRNTTGTPNSTFQLWLYESTNTVEFRYGTLGSGSMSASVGLRGAASSPQSYHSITVSSNTTSTTAMKDNNADQPASGRMYSFTEPPACSGTPVGGTTALSTTPGCGTGNFTLSVTAPVVLGITYQWQSSPDGFSWTDITNDTLPGLTAAPVSVATYYRRNTICTASTLIGSSSSILVKPVYGGNAQSTNAVCGDSITLSLTNQSASISSFQWLESPDSLTWTPISGATSSTQKVPSPTSKMYYRAYVTCTTSSSSDTSLAVTVAPVKGGTTAITSSICLDSTLMSITGSSTGSALTYSWLSSVDSLVWTPMSITTATAKFPSPTSTMYYRSVLTCGTSSDTSIAKRVDEPCQGFKYSITQTGSITYNSIQSTGNTFTWNGTSGDDDRSLPVYFPPGFNFTYNGQVRPAFYVCTNGWLALDTTALSTAYGNDLSATSPKAVLAPFWDDLVTLSRLAANRSYIKYQVTGTAPNRVMIAEWAEMELYSSGSPSLNFQVRMYEGTNNIEYVYGRMQPFDGTSNTDYTYSLGMTGNNPSLGQRISLLWPNTANFSSSIVNNSLPIIPSCYSSYLFTAGATFNPTSTSTIPSNDSSSMPVVLVVNPSPCTDGCGNYYTTLNATASGTAIAPVSGNPDDDVWFSFVAPLSGQVNISIISSSGFDPAFQVMTNTFDTTGLGAAGSRNAASNSLESVVASGLTPSSTYLIRVFNSGSGSGSTSGAFSICVNEVIPPPANDDTTGAIVLTASTNCTPITGTTLGATASPQSVCGGIADDDVWYKFTPSASSDTVTVMGSGTFQAHVQVLTQAMTSISCLNTNVNADTVKTVLTGLLKDSTYFVRVYHTNAGTASANFTICLTGDSATAPIVTTASPAYVYDVTASIGGTISSTGGYPVTASGVVYGPLANPVIGGPAVVDSTNNPVIQLGAFSKVIGGLSPSNTYHYRTYATNVLGTTYGADSTFTTTATPIAPSMNAIAASSILATQATVGGSILGDGGSPVTGSGIVYGTSPNPIIGAVGAVDSTTSPLITSGSFSFTISGLTASTKYYFRSYALNSFGTGYSVQDSFTTAPIISSLPYTQDFEGASASDFHIDASGSNDWALGNPAKTYLNGAHSGTKAWATKLTNDPYSNNHDASVVSPQFDFTSLTADPILRFYHKFVTEADWDAMVVEISINGGLWTKLDNNLGTGTNYNTLNSYSWYNNSSTSGPAAPSKFSSLTSGDGSDVLYSSQTNGWIQSATKLTGAAGQGDVKFRFRFASDGSGFDEGWTIDDIEVVSITTPTTPASSVVLSSTSGANTDVSWTNGDGTGRLVVAHLAATTPVAPTNNTLYNANPFFGNGDSTGLGNYVVYSNSGNSVTATGLTDFTTYSYDVYEYNGKYMHISFSSIPASNSATTLPVSFTSFTATPNKGDILLDWATASEINNSGFMIERSLNGRDFKEVDFVKGAGNSSRIVDYSFTDVNAFNSMRSSVIYYRLKQVDFDGAFNYSNVVRVTKNPKETNILSVYPNPYNNQFSIDLVAANDGKVMVEMMDIQGRVVRTNEFTLVKGSNVLKMNETSSLENGVYFLRVTVNRETQMLKMIKN
jgi:hypothetical protein